MHLHIYYDWRAIHPQLFKVTIFKVTIFVSGLTDDEVQLAIQRSGSTEEVLPLTPVGLPQPVHAAQLVPVPHSESQSLTHRGRGMGVGS